MNFWEYSNSDSKTKVFELKREEKESLNALGINAYFIQNLILNYFMFVFEVSLHFKNPKLL